MTQFFDPVRRPGPGMRTGGRAIPAAVALGLAVSLIAVAPAGVARANIVDEGRSLISGMSSTVIDILKRDLSRQEKENRFRGLFRKNFDVRTIGRWVMGRPWRQATADQRSRYMAVFEVYIVKTYTAQLSKFAGEKLKVITAEKDGRGVAVVSHIVTPDSRNRPVVIKWRLRKRRGGPLLVRDVVIQGISMSLNQRREFASVYARRGSVDGLIEALRKKIAQLNRN